MGFFFKFLNIHIGISFKNPVSVELYSGQHAAEHEHIDFPVRRRESAWQPKTYDSVDLSCELYTPTNV